MLLKSAYAEHLLNTIISTLDKVEAQFRVRYNSTLPSLPMSRLSALQLGMNVPLF